jgi:NADH-quinone oxidoreductase subunit K
VFGLCGVFLSRKNLILTIMSLEVMLLAVNFNLVFFSTYLDDVVGHMFILFILAVGASETAIGLSLVIAYYKHFNA